VVRGVRPIRAAISAVAKSTPEESAATMARSVSSNDGGRAAELLRKVTRKRAPISCRIGSSMPASRKNAIRMGRLVHRAGQRTADRQSVHQMYLVESGKSSDLNPGIGKLPLAFEPEQQHAPDCRNLASLVLYQDAQSIRVRPLELVFWRGQL
jgi:hypothetical protein